MYPYRVFLSYAHEDKEDARKLRDFLSDMDLAVMWDENIAISERFSDRIRRDISRAHLFVPLITETSLQRPWVHHETGFAMGLGVPVLTVAVDTVPEGMTAELQAVRVSADLRPEDLATKLHEEAINDLVAQADETPQGAFESVEYPEERARRFATYIGELPSRVRAGCTIRQDGALTSFNIPRSAVNSAEWDAREGLQRRTQDSRQALLRERQAFDGLAQVAGCKLIIDPTVPFRREREHAPRVRRARLTVLRQFLESMAECEGKVQIVSRPRQDEPNVTIVGDWFSATAQVSLQPQFGYRETLFTWHAPTVLEKMLEFDRKFDELDRATNFGGKSSREWAIDLINETLEGITDTTA